MRERILRALGWKRPDGAPDEDHARSLTAEVVERARAGRVEAVQSVNDAGDRASYVVRMREDARLANDRLSGRE